MGFIVKYIGLYFALIQGSVLLYPFLAGPVPPPTQPVLSRCVYSIILLYFPFLFILDLFLPFIVPFICSYPPCLKSRFYNERKDEIVAFLSVAFFPLTLWSVVPFISLKMPLCCSPWELLENEIIVYTTKFSLFFHLWMKSRLIWRQKFPKNDQNGPEITSWPRKTFNLWSSCLSLRSVWDDRPVSPGQVDFVIFW